MTGKKIIANLLLLSIIGLNGHFNGIQAAVSNEEWRIITTIENQRHDPRLKLYPTFRSELISGITEKIRSRENMNIEFYYQSVLCKLSGTSCIHLDDTEALYEKEFFATLIYRILSDKINNNIPINPQELSWIKGLLTQKVRNLDDFKKLNDMDKLNIARICLMCSEYHVLDRSTLDGVLEIIGRFIETNQASPKLLITFGKIPHNTTARVYALKEAITTIYSKNPEKAKYDPRCIEALITLGKIQYNKAEQISVLKGAIRILDELHRPLNDPQLIEALLTLGKIPHNPYEQFVVLNTVRAGLPANDSRHIDATIALCRIRDIAIHEKIVKLKETIRILNELRRPLNDPQRIEALLALARIPNNTDEQIKALEELSNLQNPELTEKIKKIARNILSQCKYGQSIDDKFNCFRLRVILGET